MSTQTTTLTVNGEEHTTTATDIAGLVHEITGNDATAGIAVALDGHVVSASQWDRELSDGATIDILNARQGG